MILIPDLIVVELTNILSISLVSLIKRSLKVWMLSLASIFISASVMAGSSFLSFVSKDFVCSY